MQTIEVIGARKHNLKDISVSLPKRQLITITGVSGSGKSSLAFDTIFQEGQRKYLESLSIYARQFIKTLEKPEVRTIRGISPTISIDQKHSSFFHRSTVGTISEISQYMRLMFSKVGTAVCPKCGREISTYSSQKILDHIVQNLSGESISLYAPVVRNRKGNYRALFEKYAKKGFLKGLVDGEVLYLDAVPELDRNVRHDIAIMVDAVTVTEKNRRQLDESIRLATFESHGELIVIRKKEELFFSNKLYCTHCQISLKEPQPATFSFNSPLGACLSCNGSGKGEEGVPRCPDCRGSGLNDEARAFYIHRKNIHELGEMEVGDLLSHLMELPLSEYEKKILSPIIPQIIQRLESLVRLKLGYITLNRKIYTLSGGELQRTRLVSQLGFGLSGVIYILDEPSIGMHMAEQLHLIEILKELQQKDNTIIVVEHDENTIRASDYIVDLGPGSGENGGEVVFAGNMDAFEKTNTSLTSDYVFKRRRIKLNRGIPKGKKTAKTITIRGIGINNLNGVDLKIPRGSFSVITGLSGSGKSSLMVDAFYPIVKNRLDENNRKTDGVRYTNVTGLDDGEIGRILMVNQSSIGKNSRSCPATYVQLMSPIRDLFASLPESRVRGYQSRHFGFNVPGGRCEACSGLGCKKLEMSFLPNLEVPCPVCGGKRYNTETLKIKYKGMSIADILDLTASDAYGIFRQIPWLSKKIKILMDVGLGYLRLGQSSVTLSGGESQRIKLSRELSRRSAKSTVYVLDEPTVGLHFHDIQKLIDVFYSFVDKGDTVVVIEHNMEIIKAADYVVDMGPGGGKDGGEILYQGKLPGLLKCGNSVTGRLLKEVLSRGD